MILFYTHSRNRTCYLWLLPVLSHWALCVWWSWFGSNVKLIIGSHDPNVCCDGDPFVGSYVDPFDVSDDMMFDDMDVMIWWYDYDYMMIILSWHDDIWLYNVGLDDILIHMNAMMICACIGSLEYWFICFVCWIGITSGVTCYVDLIWHYLIPSSSNSCLLSQ